MKHVVLMKMLGVALIGFSSASFAAGTVDAAVLEKGKVLFKEKTIPACALCHTLADAGATGAIGPDLDELKPDLDRVKKAMKEGMGAMPSFAATLKDDDIDAVAAYVVHATGGDK